MARRFRSTFTSKVDSKGRMSVPAKHRKVFDLGDPDFVNSENGRTQIIGIFATDDWNWVELYPIENFEELEDEMQAMERGSDERNWLEYLYTSFAFDLEIDREGRVVLPAELREKLGLTDGSKPVFMARGDYVQLYNPDSEPADLKALKEFASGFKPGFDARRLASQKRD